MDRKQILELAIQHSLVANAGAAHPDEHYSPVVEDADITQAVLDFAHALLVAARRNPLLTEISTRVDYPIQPLVLDSEGVLRFKGNKIVCHLLDHGGLDMNALARLDFPAEDREQFAQLIGYSLSGFSNLSYVSDDVYAKAAASVETREASAVRRTGAHPALGAPFGGFPDRDKSKPAEQQGQFRKFTVRRNDGSDLPGGKHEGCHNFVLDLTHDVHALPAIRAYAASCRATHPVLAAELEALFGVASAADEWLAAIDSVVENANYVFKDSCSHTGQAIDYMRALMNSRALGTGLLSESEQRALLQNPAAIAMLMDYHDVQQSHAESVGAGCTGNQKRYAELRETAKRIVEVDPELWPVEVQKKFLGEQAAPCVMKPDHDLYTDADKDRPDVICDSNGQVVLGLCKTCGRGECELDEPCLSGPGSGGAAAALYG